MKIIDAQTVSLDATFTEPALPSGSNPLAYYYIQYQTPTGNPVIGPHIPASANGNENVATTILVPAPDGQITTYAFEVIAVDSIGKSSSPSNIVSDTINRTSPPAPTNFSIA